MAKNVQSLQRSAYAVVAVVLMVGSVSFGYYMWTGTVVHKDPNDRSGDFSESDVELKPKYPLATALTIEETKGVVLATFRLTNVSQARLLLPDTAAIEPLYSVSLRYSQNKDTPFAPAPKRGQPPRASGSETAVVETEPRVAFDRRRDGTVELVWGSSLVKQIGLSQFFDIQKPGRYELTVRYRPMNVVGTDLPEFNVSGSGATLVFELPLNSAPAPDKAPKPNSSPAPAPVPAPRLPENPVTPKASGPQ